MSTKKSDTPAKPSNRPTGGKMVHLTPELLARVEAYKEKFEAATPGIAVTINGILTNLVHHGLTFVERGPFERIRGARHDVVIIDDPLDTQLANKDELQPHVDAVLARINPIGSEGELCSGTDVIDLVDGK